MSDLERWRSRERDSCSFSWRKRAFSGVEVEIEGERWVTDLHYEVLSADEEGGSAKRKGKKKEKEKDSERELLKRIWESRRPSRKGEWRRRRWVRGVERIPASSFSE